MLISELREKYIKFFEKKNHLQVSSFSLIAKDSDNSVLFNIAGMQPFKQYFSFEKDVKKELGSKKLVSSQKCIRTKDIDKVGDNSHLTFFEMLGNFSFDSYFKKEAIEFAYDFIFNELKLNKSDIVVTVFGGNNTIPFDEEAFLIWKELGIENIEKGSFEDNFWGPVGKIGVCGPCSEIFYRGVEIWNLVFVSYFLNDLGVYTELKKKCIDTGAGLERMCCAINGFNSVYELDVFVPIFDFLKQNAKVYDEKSFRIIADHFKAACFLIADKVIPGNSGREYILRRLIRRGIRYANKVGVDAFDFILDIIIVKYSLQYPELKDKEYIVHIFKEEESRFLKTLEKGIKVLKKISDDKKALTGEEAFHIYETYGFPLELIIEELGFDVDEKGFNDAFEKHREISRQGVEKKFGGHGIKDEKGDILVIKHHTAAHLLLQALRELFGKHIYQKGFDINSERLRFDFPFERKMEKEELKQIEDLVNSKIKENLPVVCEEMDVDIAFEKGYLGTFRDKYPDKVTTYDIGGWSREICAGPHVKNTSELGEFKIIKEESSSKGVRRIKAKLIK